MHKEYKFDFGELQIVPEDLISLLGFEPDNIPTPFPELIEQSLKQASFISQIRGGYVIYPIKINADSNTIQIEEQIFSPGKIIIVQFKNAQFIAVFTCTAGEGFTKQSVQENSDGDPLKSYIFDVIGSVTVEKAMDKIQKEIEKDFANKGLCISDRFSPGYCDWDVKEQQNLFALFPENFCNISLSSSSLMNPVKSVSGFIAAGKGLKQKGYQCHWCNDTNCYYGKIKRRKKN